MLVTRVQFLLSFKMLMNVPLTWTIVNTTASIQMDLTPAPV